MNDQKTQSTKHKAHTEKSLETSSEEKDSTYNPFEDGPVYSLSKISVEDAFVESYVIAYQFSGSLNKSFKESLIPFSAMEDDYTIPRSACIPGDPVNMVSLMAHQKKSAVLSQDTIARLKEAMYEGVVKLSIMDCYSPHHAFVFYDYCGTPIACIEVCFRCNAVKISRGNSKYIDELQPQPDLLMLAKLCFDAGLSIGEYKNFSEYKENVKEMLNAIEADTEKDH